MITKQNAGSATPARKKSTSETGHAVNLANLQLLIQTVAKLGEKYNPSNEDLTIESLKTLYLQSKKKLEDCVFAETVFDTTTDERSDLFKKLRTRSSSVNRIFKASKVPISAKEGAQTIMNQLKGKPAKIKKKDLLANNEEVQKTVSNSQQSYVQLVQHFKGLRELIYTFSEYAPNEEELTKVALIEFEKSLEHANENAGDAITGWKSTLRNRNEIFYTEESGLVDTALAVKDYVAAVFTVNSAQFKEVNKIKFRNIKDR